MIIRAAPARVSQHRASCCGVNVIRAVAGDTECVERPDGARAPHRRHGRGQTRVSEAPADVMMEVVRLRGHVGVTQLGAAHHAARVTPGPA